MRNLSPGARDLVVMFTESEADVGHLSLEGIRPMRGPARLGGGGGGSGSFGASDMDDDGDGGVAKDISPVVGSRTHEKLVVFSFHSNFLLLFLFYFLSFFNCCWQGKCMGGAGRVLEERSDSVGCTRGAEVGHYVRDRSRFSVVVSLLTDVARSQLMSSPFPGTQHRQTWSINSRQFDFHYKQMMSVCIVFAFTCGQIFGQVLLCDVGQFTTFGTLQQYLRSRCG